MVIYKYFEIKCFENGEVIKRIDCSGMSDHSLNKMEMGFNINLNHDKYYTRTFDSEIKLDTI